MVLDESDDMEAVADDLGVWKPLSDQFPVGATEVDADDLDLLPTFEAGEKSEHFLLTLAWDDIEDLVVTGGSTAPLCLSGIEAGLQGSHRSQTIALSYYNAGSAVDIEVLHRHLEHLFRQKGGPDALFFNSDLLAAASVEWLLARGISVPDEVSVIAGTGLHPAHDEMLPCTVIQQPFEKIGREAVRMAVQGLQMNAPIPGKFLETDLRIGRTTREVENIWFTERSGDSWESKESF